jgi:hypothetical protein
MTKKLVERSVAVAGLLGLLFILSGCGGAASPPSTLTTTGCGANCSPTPGSVINVAALSTCPTGYATGMSCSQATVVCPGTADLNVTYGYMAPPSGPINGTVFFHAGGSGDVPLGISEYIPPYSNTAGFALVQMAWASSWEDTGLTVKNVGVAACRPATLMNYIFQQVATPGGAKCAQGFSAGSAAVGYALAWYGAGSYLDNAELLSGPVFSDIEQGCMVPQPPQLSVCTPGQFGCPTNINSEFLDFPAYDTGGSGTATGVGLITGDASCDGSANTTPQSNANWKAMSIVNGTTTPSFSYPKTAMAGWVCNNGLNPSAAQGDLFYQQFTGPGQTAGFSLYPVTNCLQAEGVGSGTVDSLGGEIGSVAISNDMIAHCIVRH